MYKNKQMLFIMDKYDGVEVLAYEKEDGFLYFKREGDHFKYLRGGDENARSMDKHFKGVSDFDVQALIRQADREYGLTKFNSMSEFEKHTDSYKHTKTKDFDKHNGMVGKMKGIEDPIITVDGIQRKDCVNTHYILYKGEDGIVLAEHSRINTSFLGNDEYNMKILYAVDRDGKDVKDLLDLGNRGANRVVDSLKLGFPNNITAHNSIDLDKIKQEGFKVENTGGNFLEVFKAGQSSNTIGNILNRAADKIEKSVPSLRGANGLLTTKDELSFMVDHSSVKKEIEAGSNVSPRVDSKGKKNKLGF